MTAHAFSGASVLALTTALLATPAHAQNALPAQVEEIVVTAERRSERLQDVPVTMQAFDQKTIQAAGLSQVDQLARLTPGLNVGAFAPSKPQIYMRGIGTRQIDIGSDPSVGVFLDDIYVGRSSGSVSNIADIERIEVLKGPQGTLYGRNTIGGAIAVTTPDPSDETAANLEIGGGNFEAYNVKGYLNGALIPERLDGRISAFYVKRNGYVVNTATGNTALGLDQFGVRGKLRFTPTDRLSAVLTVDLLRDRSPGQQGESEGPDVFLRSPLVALPTLTPDRFSEAYNLDSPTHRNVDQASLRAEWAGDDAVLTSITAFRRSRLVEDADVDSTPLAVLEQATFERSRELSQEFRIVSDRAGRWSLGGRLDWLAGVYLYRDDAVRTDRFVWGADSLPVLVGRFSGVTGLTSVTNDATLDRVVDGQAIYGQATVHVTDAVSVTAGLRYSRDHKEGVYVGSTDHIGLPVLSQPFSIPLDRTWTSTDPRLTVDWKPARDVMVFATVSRGYKSGGFQWAVTDPALAAGIFNPETVDYYELGAKTRWLGGALVVNGALFYNDYRNLQVQRLVGTPGGGASNVISNAAASTIKGGELEVTARPGEGWLINVGYAYLNARYDNYVFAPGVDFSETRMVRSPENTLNASVQYDRDLGEDLTLQVRASAAYTSSFFFEPGEDRVSSGNREPAYTTVDLRASLSRGAYRVTVFASNLLDEHYRTARLSYPGTSSPFGTTGPQSVGYLGAPRMVGATVSWTLR
ncbi:TonB-dependent receptor [Phenylobacterium sp. Root700]|uniref:TonB-dependent receptor n=1 Tax=Phenylobacterium sp. Root700 TaxID=1736591 RepID=UPI0009EC78E8|nr:TonB-dependent receptor [Phenylobacterium sp. Root700]